MTVAISKISPTAPLPESRPGRFDPSDRPYPEGSKQPRTGRLQLARRPLQEIARRRIAHHAPPSQSDHPIREPQAPLKPVLGHQDRHIEVLVEPSQQAHQLIARDRVEL